MNKIYNSIVYALKKACNMQDKRHYKNTHRSVYSYYANVLQAFLRTYVNKNCINQ